MKKFIAMMFVIIIAMGIFADYDKEIKFEMSDEEIVERWCGMKHLKLDEYIGNDFESFLPGDRAFGMFVTAANGYGSYELMIVDANSARREVICDIYGLN